MAAISPAPFAEDWKHPMASNARHSLPPGYDGSNGGGPRNGGTTQPLPHVADLVSVGREIDTQQSIKRLLEQAESSLNTAEMGRDFKRPASALKEFLRASIITVQIIRSHKDFPQLRGTSTDLGLAHSNLLKKISQQHDSFMKIKEAIILDNKRTGVKPTAKNAPLGKEPVAGRDTPPQTGSPLSQANGSPRKSKPTVQPKPESLHGNAIKLGHNRAASVQPDLLSRFANLRGPQSSPGQDSRIKTHQIVLPKPSGPREMPPSEKPKLGLNSSVSSLPKMPDAVYSPARGNASGEAARAPASTPRGIVRTGSSMSMAGTPTQSQQPQSNDYFSGSANGHSGHSGSSTSAPVVPIPQGNIISPNELYQAMKGKGSILLIDVRDRESYDEGHIMSSSTICIDPNILMREGLSAEQISESLVLSPNDEHGHFDRREQFDLVVFYDQDSEAYPRSAANSETLALQSLHRALTDFNYGHELKNSAKMLKGGLDAWIDLMGPSSLQASSTSGSTSGSLVRGSRSAANPGLSRARRAGDISKQRRSKYMPDPLKADEIKVWQETLKNDDMETESSPSFVRTREDFLRRFPSVSEASESMTSSGVSDNVPMYGSSHKLDLTSDLPSPPTRPAPALPRPSYSSLTHLANDSIYQEPDASLKTSAPFKAAEAAPSSIAHRYYTGLNNPGNWCYSNGILQSLLVTPGFGHLLANSDWKQRYTVPRKPNEKIDQPQLMTRILTNLFHWMGTGKFKVMKAQTLMDFSRQLTSKRFDIGNLGSSEQQDAGEFMTFLLANLDEETNTRRDRLDYAQQPDMSQQPLVYAAAEYWRSHSERNDSVVDQYWRGLYHSLTKCEQCGLKTQQFEVWDFLPITLVEGPPVGLHTLLAEYFAPEPLEDYACDRCKAKATAKYVSLARLPAVLCISLVRFDRQLRKRFTKVTWDVNDIDLSRYFLPPSDRNVASVPDGDKAFTAPFRYECYAIVVHAGTTLNGGHYYAYVRDPRTQDPYAWLKCNDERIERVRIGSGTPDDIQDLVFKEGPTSVPYLLYFRRKTN